VLQLRVARPIYSQCRSSLWTIAGVLVQVGETPEGWQIPLGGQVTTWYEIRVEK